MKNKKQSPSSLHCSVAMSIVLCFLLLCTVSCHKKPIIRTVKVISECYDNDNFRSSWEWFEQESLPPLLSSITQSLNGTVYNKDLYEYNGQQLVRIHRDLTYSSPIEMVFGYDNRGRVATQTLNDNDGVLGKATFTYNDLDQIVRAEYQFDDDFAKHQYYVAPWHQAAHRAIVERLKSMKKDAKETYNVLVDYVYEGGNLVSESWAYDGESQVIYYTYDNAVNPFQGLWMLDEELVLYPDQLSTNNVLTTIYYEDGDTDTDNNTYLYDEENYPVALIQSLFENDTIRWNYKQFQYKVLDPK
ncbi:MAG: hypothetical protein K5890_07560 [Bacteroidales bacterium]|nr:hypothetical protein [Bacteroidales bacterium]